MVCIRKCNECINGNHKDCALSENCKAGHFGGSMCSCPCHGNPNFNNPNHIHKELMRELENIQKFEERSSKVNYRIQ